MKIKKFIQFILESKGVANETLVYCDEILKVTKEYFNDFIKSDDLLFENDIMIDELPSTENYPISKVDLNINFTRLSDEEFTKKFPTISARGKYFTTTGICYNIGEEGGSEKLEDGTIKLKMGVGAIINKDKFNLSDVELVYLEIESALTHELNHSYEGFHRDRKDYPGLSSALTYSLDYNTENVPDNVWMIWWKELGYFIYWTERFELNAMTQDAYPYVKKYRNIEDMKKNTPSWDFYERMSKFNPIDFKNRLSIEINKTMPGENPEEVLTKMKNGLADKLRELLDEEGTENASIDPKIIKKLNIDDFLDYCSKRIKSGSEKLRRGILRHYSNK